MIAVLALTAIMFWTVGLAGLVAWFLDQRDRRRLSEFRAEQLIAQARAEYLPWG